MCGIAGFFLPCEVNSNTKTLFNQTYIQEEILELIKHRGPDDYGFYKEKNNELALFHRRLSIIDLNKTGHQPIKSNCGNFTLVFNGEIYNYKSLKESIDSKFDVLWKGKSDTEVLLNLLVLTNNENKSLDEKLNKINGIFSFAIWDNNKKELIVARDALGVKPLYYFNSPNFFAFASEIKALMPLLRQFDYSDESENNNLEISPNAINKYLSFLWCPGIETPFKNVKKLEPGSFLKIKNGKIIENKKWYKLPIFNIKSSSKFSKDLFIKETEKYLRRAVENQLVSDVPLGAFLSGGLDSSSIVTFAREINPDINCFTIKTKGDQERGRNDDFPYASKVASYLKVPLEVVQVNSEDIVKEIENMVWQLDEPIADPAALNIFFISKLAKSKGIKVLLSGTGGDDLFTGYRRHIAVEYQKYWDWIPKYLRTKISFGANYLNTSNPLTRRIKKTLSVANFDGDERLIEYFRWISNKQLKEIYTEEFKNAINEHITKNPMIDFLQDLPNDLNDLERVLFLEKRFFLADHNLNYTDKMSMKNGIEVRVPFLDLELINFVSKIPKSFKQRHGQSKWILKKTMEPYLPKDIIYRSKTGFGVPLRKWLKYELKDWLNEILSFEKLKKRGFFKPEEVNKLICANQNDEIEASYTLLSLACVEIWCEKFIDGNN